MGKKGRRRLASAPNANLARAVAQQRADAEWSDEVEEIFKDTHPWLRCDKLSNVVFWFSLAVLVYWCFTHRFGLLLHAE